MTTQTLSPFPSAFPPRPPLAHARLDADGAENLLGGPGANSAARSFRLAAGLTR